ncbi:MAG: hypothetical protein IKX56_04780 [Muribaculaceae bacterium]|nr:hypothetical protein [Muribaculaceae bacterium]
MKKLALTIAVVLGLALTTFANTNDGGLFQRGASEPSSPELFANRSGSIALPDHNSDQNGDASPLGSGVAVLLGLGAAYMVAKKRKED